MSHSNWWHFYVNNIGFVWKQNSRDLINYFLFFSLSVYKARQRGRELEYIGKKRRLWKVIKWNRNRRNCFLFEFNFNEIHHFSSFTSANAYMINGFMFSLSFRMQVENSLLQLFFSSDILSWTHVFLLKLFKESFLITKVLKLILIFRMAQAISICRI